MCRHGKPPGLLETDRIGAFGRSDNSPATRRGTSNAISRSKDQDETKESSLKPDRAPDRAKSAGKAEGN
jgi:hypothetical protein